MFVLTCPHCSNTTKVRFARMGATATCPQCKEQYKVARDTMQVENDERPTPEPTQTLSFGDHAQDQAEAKPTSVDTSAVEELAGSVADPLAAAEESIHHPAADRHADALKTQRSNAARQRLRKRKKTKSDTPLIAISLISMAALIGLIIWLVDPFGGKKPVVNPDPGPNTVNNNPPDPNPGPRLPNLSKLTISAKPMSRWIPLPTPVGAMTPAPPPGTNVRLWNTQFDNGGKFGPEVTVAFAADIPGVYRGITLRVQLLNKDNLAIAELNLNLTDIIPRDGFFQRIQIPANLADQTQTAIAELKSAVAMKNVGLLQNNLENMKIVHEDDDELIVQVQVHNPNAHTVRNPNFLLELYNTNGKLYNRWDGFLIDKQVAANSNLSFLITLPKPIDAAFQPGRFIIRGFGDKN